MEDVHSKAADNIPPPTPPEDIVPPPAPPDDVGSASEPPSIGVDQTSTLKPGETLIVYHPHSQHVRADLGGHLKYSRRWSGVRAGVLLGAQGAVHRGENRGGL